MTSNATKVTIASERLSRYGIHVKRKHFDFKEMQSLDVGEVAIDKARQVICAGASEDFIVDDSGFYVDALNGFPGAYLKPVFDAIGDEKFLKLMHGIKNRKCSLRSVLVYGNAHTKELRSFKLECTGALLDDAKGSRKRGILPARLIAPYGHKKSIAQMDDLEFGQFLHDLRKNDHYEKFGKWISKKA